MNIAIGSDHHGFAHKELIKKWARGPQHLAWIDVGCTSTTPCDYPEFAHAVVQAMAAKKADVGILLCGTGVGMAMTANRCPGIYAGMAWNEEIARLNKEHDNVNVLVIPADYVSKEQVVAIVNAWLNAQFLGGRHQERIEMIDKMTCSADCCE